MASRHAIPGVDDVDLVPQPVAPPPPEPGASTDIGSLWRSLVIGLMVILGMSLAGIGFTLATDRPADVFVTIFSTVFAGLIGLFVKSPLEK